MASDGTTVKKKSGMTLYADLLAGGTNEVPSETEIKDTNILSEASDYTQEQAQPKVLEEPPRKQLNNAALMFQPSRRPLPQSTKIKIKNPISNIPSNANILGGINSKTNQQVGLVETHSTLNHKFSMESLAQQADDTDLYLEYAKPQRGGRKRRKRETIELSCEEELSWDQVYDLERPNTYLQLDYDAHDSLAETWVTFLKGPSASSTPDSSPGEESIATTGTRTMNYTLVPPPSFSTNSFVWNSSNAISTSMRNEEQGCADSGNNVQFVRKEVDTRHPVDQELYDQSPSFSQLGESTTSPKSRSPTGPKRTHPDSYEESANNSHNIQAPVMTFSAAPVRYHQPAFGHAPYQESRSDGATAAQKHRQGLFLDSVDQQERSSVRPSQKNFAARLMAKQGWTKGMGLGLSGEGIVNPLRVEKDKSVKNYRTEGAASMTGSAALGKIIGPRIPASHNDDAAEEPPSKVVVFVGLVTGAEMENEWKEDRIGETLEKVGHECERRYGPIERLHIHENEDSFPPVFIKFKDHHSALQAVNLVRQENSGGQQAAKYYAEEKFEAGIYE